MRSHLVPIGATLYARPPARMLLDVARLEPDELRAMLRSGRLGVEGGAGPVDSVEAAILNHAIGKATWTPPTSYWIGLSTTTPTDAAGNFTEPVGNNYARIEVVTADWNAASGTAPTVATNLNPLTFAAATGSWGTLTYAGLFAASSGGSHQWFGALTASATVNTGGTVTIAAGALILQLGDTTDSY